MKLAKFEEEIREALNEAVKNAIREEETVASETVNTNEGYIEIAVGRDRKFAPEVFIYHDNGNDYTMPNLQAWIENIIKEYNGPINWLEVELEMLDDIDTSDEAEYWHPGVTNQVCSRARAIRKQIDTLKRAYA